jgi:hypothetical protein
MSLLRLLDWQGIAGIAVSLALALLLVIQKAEIRHWKKQSGELEQLYSKERAAHAGTIANYRAAADAARAADAANLERVSAEQRSINERTEHDFEARLAAARTLAQRLRGQAAAADPGARGAASVPGLPAPAGGPVASSGEDGLPDSDRLLATEQAIQLDELINWIREQAAVDSSAQK